jgi:hypothetical protein
MLGRPIAKLFTDENCHAGVPKQELRGTVEKRLAVDERWPSAAHGRSLLASGEISPLLNKFGVHVGYAKVVRLFVTVPKTTLRDELCVSQKSVRDGGAGQIQAGRRADILNAAFHGR